MWMKDYFQKELNITVYHQPVRFEINGKIFLIGHGDGLGPGDQGYKLIKRVFRNKLAKMLFGLIPPAIGIGIAHYFSRKSRAQTGKDNEVFLGEENEWLVQYCKEKLQTEHYDYFVFGHRHLPLDIKLNEKSSYINLGDWITFNTFGKFNGNTLTLQSHQP
jgi:UDP-2,3-diacylglucosamine hydrolase